AAFASDGGAVTAPKSSTSAVASPTSRADTEFEFMDLFLSPSQRAAKQPPKARIVCIRTTPAHTGSSACAHRWECAPARRWGAAHAVGTETSGQTQPRIEDRIEDVGHEVEEDHEHGKDEKHG